MEEFGRDNARLDVTRTGQVSQLTGENFNTAYSEGRDVHTAIDYNLTSKVEDSSMMIGFDGTPLPTSSDMLQLPGDKSEGTLPDPTSSAR